MTIASASLDLIGTSGLVSDYATTPVFGGTWYFYAKKPCKVKLTVTTSNGRTASKVITIANSVIPITSMSICTKSATDGRTTVRKSSMRDRNAPPDWKRP